MHSQGFSRRQDMCSLVCGDNFATTGMGCGASRAPFFYKKFLNYIKNKIVPNNIKEKLHSISDNVSRISEVFARTFFLKNRKGQKFGRASVKNKIIPDLRKDNYLYP